MVKVKGLKSFERKMKVAIPRAVERHVKGALAVYADKIVASAESLVPEDTGGLKNSIGWVWGKDIPEGAMALGTVAKDDDGLVITVFAGNGEAFYARWVEFGTSQASASPYFYPAYHLNKRGGKARITRAIKKGLKEGCR